MKAFEVSDAIRKIPHIHQAVMGTRSTLEEVLGESAGLVRAVWGLDPPDQYGRQALRLTLSDFAGSASAHFAEAELRQPRHLWDRLHHLWGDVLQDRSRKQLERLRQLVPSGDES
jgi:hypothetical protein